MDAPPRARTAAARAPLPGRRPPFRRVALVRQRVARRARWSGGTAMTPETDPPTLIWPAAPAGWRTRPVSVSIWCADVDRWHTEHPEDGALLDEAERKRAARLRTPLLQRRF